MGEVTSNGERNIDLNIVTGFDIGTIPIFEHRTFMCMDDLSFDDLFNFGNRSGLQAAEGTTVADEERATEVPKASEICNDGVGLDKTSEKDGGSSSDDASFFDCNICLHMAKDPIVTCCGHLFCWPCIYTWLDMESKAMKTCPVCKEEVTVKNVTPIYGCGTDHARVHKEEEDSNLNIPPRPNPKHLQRRRLNLNLELGQPYDLDNADQGVERSFTRNSMFQTYQWWPMVYSIFSDDVDIGASPFPMQSLN